MEKKIWEKFYEPPLEWRWKILRFSNAKDKGEVIAYFDARDAEKRLDECFTPAGWQDEYYQVKDTLFCRLGIYINDQWIWKSGAGVERKGGEEIKLKGEASDAFKLACTKWGLFGRKAYKEASFWINCKPFGNSFAPVDGDGERIWDLSAFVNKCLMNGIVKNKIAYQSSKANPKPKVTKTNEQIKENKLNSRDELEYSKENAIAKINKFFNKKYINNKVKTRFLEIANKANFQEDYYLLDDKLNLIETLMINKSYMETSVASDFYLRILECSLVTASELMTEIMNYRK